MANNTNPDIFLSVEQENISLSGEGCSAAEVAATAFALLTEITYWEATSDATFAPEREKWRDAVAFHLKERLKHPSEKDFFQPEAWLALAVYNVLFPNDKEINDLLLKTDEAYTGRYRPIRDIRDYSWDMAAAYIRYQKTKNSYLITDEIVKSPK